MSSANLPAKTELAARPYDLLVYSEIIPVLPNFSTADLLLIGSHEARQEALSTVLRAVDELLAERGASQQEPVDESASHALRCPHPKLTRGSLRSHCWSASFCLATRRPGAATSRHR